MLPYPPPAPRSSARLPRRASRALALSVLAACAGLARPASATTYVMTVNADGTFSLNGGAPKITIRSGDTIQWTGLGRRDSIVPIQGLTTTSNPNDVCFVGGTSTPDYAYPFRKTFDPSTLNEITGPVRRGLSGVWVLAPEGGKTSYIEIPSAEATAINPAAATCADLTHVSAATFTVPDPANPGGTLQVKYKYIYEDTTFKISKSDPTLTLPGTAQPRGNPPPAPHILCDASAKVCDANGLHCLTKVPPSPTLLGSIPDGVYMNGVLSSTYANPDVTGVVLRFNWKDLQIDDNGTVRFDWTVLDRELERAIKGGKYVTLDVRAGRYGTPDWIFQDYLDPASPYKSPRCTAAPCSFTAAPADAGQVEALTFTDYYDEEQDNYACGTEMRLGAPNDAHYRALYQGLVSGLAAHLREDARWFAAVAHVKASGMNLQTSEAELPHHCDDDFLATGDHQVNPKDPAYKVKDRILDVFKALDPATSARETNSCVCNSKIWYEHGYRPEQLYTYYAQLENKILTDFFGRKSIGYQILQAGFPRADNRPNGTGSFFGDHLYAETLAVSAADGVEENIGYSNGAVCSPPGSICEGLACVPASLKYEVCSPDTAASYASSVRILNTPLRPWSAQVPLSMYTSATNLYTIAGGRYPAGTEQSEQVLFEAGNGRFGNPGVPGYVNPQVGKLFVPQHSGLQPLPQERTDLVYESDPSAECEQERPRIAPPAVLPAGIGALGTSIASFPIPPGTTISTLDNRKGCPNEWIVNAGVRPAPNAPPPQLTGYQTTNRVRSAESLESALFNLVYNTNAVFVELYEDVVWRVSVEKGVSTDPTPPDLLSSRQPGGVVCQYTNVNGIPTSKLCYSKRLSEWAEELHYRRAVVAQSAMAAGYAALESPFPTTYSYTFQNPGTAPLTYTFINPSRCDPTKVSMTGVPASNAVGTVVVIP